MLTTPPRSNPTWIHRRAADENARSVDDSLARAATGRGDDRFAYLLHRPLRASVWVRTNGATIAWAPGNDKPQRAPSMRAGRRVHSIR